MEDVARTDRLNKNGIVFLSVVMMLALVGCESDSTKVPPQSTATTAATQTTSATTSTPTTATQPTTPTSNTPVKDRQGAASLGEAFRKAAEAGTSQTWLEQHAGYPFDVDGKVRVKTAEDLGGAMTRDVGDIAAQVKAHTTCVATTRQEILEGKPWPNLDRLGKRAPREELERDLGRMGLQDGEWLVNCYHDAAPGFFLIVAASGHVRAFRN